MILYLDTSSLVKLYIEEVHSDQVSKFAEDWESYAALDFDELEAGQLVKRHGLRGFDAVHLASAKLLITGQDEISLAFSSFDKKLNDAATAEGLFVLTPID